jgi:uncharacterized protein (TIGR00730 family)
LQFDKNMNERTKPTPEPTFETIQTSIVQLWEVINQLSQVQPPNCDRYRVTIFGSARMHPSDPIYQSVQQFSSHITELGCDIITGGGPGLMQAANQGSVIADPENKTESIGLRIALDFEQESNPFVEKLYTHQTFFSRLHHFVLLSNAFVVFPGGIGTLLEMSMIWQLLQVRKLYDTPLILVGDMWSDLINWADRTMAPPNKRMANPEDIRIPICVPTIAEAEAIIRQDQAVWTQRCRLD